MKSYFKIYSFLLAIICLNVNSIYAKDGFNTSLYFENYYIHPFFETQNNYMPYFMVSYSRPEEIAQNLILLRTKYDNEQFRANFGLMTGTYAQYNLAAEPDIFKLLYEANMGLKLFKDVNLWLDAGVFESRIGMESPIGMNHPTHTRAIVAENTPYYETGAKLSYMTDDNTLLVSVMALNGWQQIQQDIEFGTISFGHQITYTLDSILTVNSSSFVGDVSAYWQEANMRYFHNLYVIYHTPFDFSIYASFDIGSNVVKFGEFQGERKTFYATTFIGQYKFSEKISFSARYENFEDPNGLLITYGEKLRFLASGYSFNLDYRLDKISGMIDPILRVEFRNFTSDDMLYGNAQKTYYDVSFITIGFMANIDFQ